MTRVDRVELSTSLFVDWTRDTRIETLVLRGQLEMQDQKMEDQRDERTENAARKMQDQVLGWKMQDMKMREQKTRTGKWKTSGRNVCSAIEIMRDRIVVKQPLSTQCNTLKQLSPTLKTTITI